MVTTCVMSANHYHHQSQLLSRKTRTTIATTPRRIPRIRISQWFMISFLLTTIILTNGVQSSSSSSNNGISISTTAGRYRCGGSTGSLPRSPSIPRSHKGRRYHHHSDRSSSSSTTLTQPDDDEQHQQQTHSSSSTTYVPPWNPSNLINSTTGLLKELYVRIPGDWEKDIILRRTKNTNIIPYYNSFCEIRQVPGDGNCLFHSISVSLSYLVNHTHYDLSTTVPITRNRDDDNDDIITSRSSNSIIKQQGRRKKHRRRKPTIDDLYIHSQLLRDQCVQFLRNKPYHKLYLQGYESIKCNELINAAAQQYNISVTEYCQIMSEDSVWGGGPEIVVLCNILQRPIHVYELISSTSLVSSNNNNHHDDDNTSKIQQHSSTTSPSSSSSNGWTSSLLSHHHHYQQHMTQQQQQQQQQQQPTFVLRRMACFGSPKFDHKDAIHILSADSRFPDLRPGQQLSAGNHFLAIFPKRPNQNNDNTDDDDDDDDDDDNDGSILRRRNNHQRKRIRGGDSATSSSSSSSSSISTYGNEYDFDDEPSLLLKPIHLLHRTLTHYFDWLSGIVQDWFM